MRNRWEVNEKLRINSHIMQAEGRYINPGDINLLQGYRIEVYATGLDVPSCMDFDESGDIILVESGCDTGRARVIRLRNGETELIAEEKRVPIIGVNCIGQDIYISNKCHITVIKADGEKQDVISGLTSNGDYGNSNVVLGNDNKIYWGQGTVTNSGVVGTDNHWIKDYSQEHDCPGSYIMLRGQNYATQNIMAAGEEMAYTGAFSPFGEINLQYEIRKQSGKPSGSIMRANRDGTQMEMVAWGLRYPSHIRFDINYRLFAANQGYEDRGSRPIANAPDEFLLIQQGNWYGWPDYAGGEPVTLSRFRPEGGVQPELLLNNYPGVPQRPYAVFPPYSGIMGFDFNYNTSFGPYGDVYIAECGNSQTMNGGEVTPFASFGHRISRIDMGTGGITTFAINKSGFPSFVTGEGGFGGPVDIVFGPDGAMYVLDCGIASTNYASSYQPNTGVIWRISRVN